MALVASLGLLHPQILSLEAVTFKGGQVTPHKPLAAASGMTLAVTFVPVSGLLLPPLRTTNGAAESAGHLRQGRRDETG